MKIMTKKKSVSAKAASMKMKAKVASAISENEIMKNVESVKIICEIIGNQ